MNGGSRERFDEAGTRGVCCVNVEFSMSSHDGTFDGAIEFGVPEIGGQLVIGDPSQSGRMRAEAGSAGAMTLDEAENIAARRLRELAIRLGDDDTDSANDEPGLATFDADRHLRTRLARRIASNGSSERADAADDTRAESRVRPLAETGVCARYLVSEALPLAAFGDGLAALATGRLGQLALSPPANEEAPVSALGLLARADQDQAGGDAADDSLWRTPDVVPDSALRLVDLIKEQRLLLDRLGRLEGLTLADAAAPAGDLADTARAEDLSEVGRSDAEELFEAGTYAPQSARSHEAEDEGLDPVSISAEQLIAALEETTLEDEEKPEPAAEVAPPAFIDGAASNLLQELVDGEPEAGPRLQFVLHQPSPLPGPANGADHAARSLSGLVFEERRLLPAQDLAARDLPAQDLSTELAPERSPIIIERARAEMTALANGAGLLHPPPPSAVVGFFAGLSLSLVCGAMLYVVL